MGACAGEIEVSAVRIRIALSSNDLRIMKGCLKPLNIILECRKEATMTFLSSDRRMTPRDLPRPTPEIGGTRRRSSAAGAARRFGAAVPAKERIYTALTAGLLKPFAGGRSLRPGQTLST